MIGTIIKILVVYHKNFVELSNFPREVARAIKYRISKLP